MRLYVSDLLIRLRFRVFHVRNDVVIIARQCRTQKNNTQQLTLPLWFWVCVCVCILFFIYFSLVHFILKMFWAAVSSHFKFLYETWHFDCNFLNVDWIHGKRLQQSVFSIGMEGIWHAKCGPIRSTHRDYFHFYFPFEFVSHFSVSGCRFCFDCRFAAIVNFHFKKFNQ